MIPTKAKATYGLQGTLTPRAPTLRGNPQIGTPQTNAIIDADVIYSIQFLFHGGAGLKESSVALSTGVATSDAWTAGAAQKISTAVKAASGATSSGNLTITAAITGSSKAITVPLTTTAHTSAALIAAACVAAVNADSVASQWYTATQSGADIVLTRKPSTSYLISNERVPIYLANDAGAGLTITAGLGVSAATAISLVTGVETAGLFVVGGDGNDFEGRAKPAITTLSAIMLIIEDETGAAAEATVGGTHFNATVKKRGDMSLSIWQAGSATIGTLDIESVGPLLATLTVSGKV